MSAPRDRLDFALLACAYAVVAVSYLALCLADGRVELAATCALFFAVSTCCEWRQIAPVGDFGNSAALLLTLATIVWGFLQADYLPPLPFFVGALLALKLLAKKTARDWKQIFALGLMHLALAAVLTVDLSFALCYFLFAVAATWSICLLHIWDEREKLRERDPRVHGDSRLGFSFLAVTGLLSLVSMVAAAGIFMVLPRVGIGNFGIQRNAARLTGFSESVKLDELGRLMQNDAPVMRVVLSGPAADRHEARYMRGVAYDAYEGQRWFRSKQRRAYLAGRNRDFRDATRPMEVIPESLRVVQEITLSPTGTHSLFAVPEPIIIRDASFYADTVEIDLYNCLRLRKFPNNDIQYTAISALPPPGIQDVRLRPAVRPKDISYTRMPPRLDPRIAELAATWWEEVEAPNELLRVHMFARKLIERCEYTLEVPRTPAGQEPVVHFLFESRAGHCELFATALALLLRSVGVAARVANGFLLNEYVPYEDYYLVRQSHAHAWTEVYAPEVGWLIVDATPSSSQSSPLLVNDSFSALLDSLGFLWTRWVISYNAEDQRQLAMDAKGLFSELKDSARAWVRSSRKELGIPRMSRWGVARGGVLLLGLLGLTIGVIAARRHGWWRRFNLFGPAAARRARVRGLLRELEATLHGYGPPRGAAETAAEWLARLALPEPARPLAGDALERFHRLRYAGQEPGPGEEAALRSAVEGLREELRAARRAG